MVRSIYVGIIQNGAQYLEFAGLSTEDKPTENLMTGSLFLEVDTGDMYAYDEEGNEWNKIASLGGDS